MLYFLAAGNKIKIGWSANPVARAAFFQVGNHEKCELLLVLAIDNTKHIESLLHERLEYCRKHGEWFEVTFQQAFEHLCKIRTHLQFKGQKELMLASTPKPTLEEHHQNFRLWMQKTYDMQEWDEERYPLEFFWNMDRDQYTSQLNKKG